MTKKFKAWDHGQKRFIDPNGQFEKWCITPEGEFAYWDDSAGWTKPHDIITIVQWSGYIDNNGVEIYEGDIVEFESYREGQLYYKAKEVIRFDLGKFHINGGVLDEYQNVVIVGNTFEEGKL